MVKLAKAANQAQKKKAPPPKQVEEEEDSSEEDSEEEEAPPAKVTKKAPPAKTSKAVKNGVTAKKAESDEDDDSEESSEEEAPPPKKAPAKTAPAKAKTTAKAAAAKAEESDDDEDDDDESEEEAPPPKKAAKAAAKPAKGPAKPAVKTKPAKESSDEEDSEEEAPPPKKGAPAKPAAKAPIKAAAKESSDDDDDEEDDDSEEEAPPPKKTQAAKQSAKPAAKGQPAEESSEEDDEEEDSEEEMDTTPAPAATKAKKAGMVKAKEESEEEEDDDDDDDDEDDDDEDDEEEDEASVKPAKRKAEGKKETPPAKKVKSDGEGLSLFVGNLNCNKDFEEIKDGLRKFFSKNDIEATDVRLGMSKRFGYVDFANEDDLNKALELNGKKFMGQEVKLDKARSKESSQEGKKERDARTLFVKNLPYSATIDDLKEVFESAVDVRLPQGQTGSNRGIAYIEFKTEAEAEKMLEEAQGAELQGRSIIVDYVGDKSQKGGRASAGGAASKTLVVNNLSFSATEEVLQSTFEKAVSVRIPQRDGRPKGFAFVEFENAEEAKEALENLNHTEIEGRSVRLEFSQSSGGRDGGRGNSGPTKTLFVKGLSEDTTDQSLKDSFEGSVGARIVTDRDTGASKGFGFVDFDNESDCKAAKEAMEDGEIDGSKVTLDYAKPKGDGGFRGGRGGGGGGGRGGFRGGRGGFGGFGGFGGRGGGRGGGGRGGRGGRGGFGGGRGGGGFGAKPQGKKIKFDD